MEDTDLGKFLDVSRSGYYIWRTRPPSQREMADAVYIEGIYNRTRRHSALAFFSPADIEATFVQPIIIESYDFVSINPG